MKYSKRFKPHKSISHAIPFFWTLETQIFDAGKTDFVKEHSDADEKFTSRDMLIGMLVFLIHLIYLCTCWEHQNFRIKIDWNCNVVGLLHHPFWFQLVLALLGHTFPTFETPLFLLSFTDEGSVPEMRKWSVLLIKSDLKWCIHLS